jgi:hypothetical protein
MNFFTMAPILGSKEEQRRDCNDEIIPGCSIPSSYRLGESSSEESANSRAIHAGSDDKPGIEQAQQQAGDLTSHRHPLPRSWRPRVPREKPHSGLGGLEWGLCGDWSHTAPGTNIALQVVAVAFQVLRQ